MVSVEPQVTGAEPTGDVRSVRPPQLWGGVPPRNPHFTGRTELLAKLKRRTVADDTRTVLPQALLGMGGVGKTQVALEYTYRHACDYDLVWWVDASQPSTIRSSLMEFAQALELPEGSQQDAVRAVAKALHSGEWSGRWLLVFDDAADPTVVRPFFPTGGCGEIIVTARDPGWAGVARSVEVGPFSRGESIERVRRGWPEIGERDADRLADALGDLPLALAQVVGLSAESGMPVSEYLDLLEDRPGEVLGTGAPADYRHTVDAVWNDSFSDVSKDSLTAYHLLQVCAFLSADPISRLLFAALGDMPIPSKPFKALADPLTFAFAIRSLRRHSLVTIDRGKNTFRMHPLVQRVVRGKILPRQVDEVQHRARLLLVANDPNDPLAVENRQQYLDLLPHVHAVNLVAGDDPRCRRLVANLVQFLFRWGRYVEAVDLAEQAFEHWTDKPGREDVQTLQMAQKLAYLYWVTGEYDDAAKLNNKTLETHRRVSGEDHVDTLAIEMQMSADLRAQGDFVEAEWSSSSVYGKAKALFGEHHPTVLRFARIHAVSLRFVGRYQEAAVLDSATHRWLAEHLGEDHPETLSALSGLCLDWREGGEYARAREEQEKLTVRAELVHGHGSPDALRRQAYLAVSVRRTGDHDRALTISRKTFSRLETRFGLRDFNTLGCGLAYSIDLRHADLLEEAKAQGEEIHGYYRETMGDHHPFTKCAAVNLAVTLRALGDAAGARQLSERALELFKRSLGPDHLYRILCSINLASDLAALGRTEEALAVGEDAVERAQRVLGSEHPTTLAAELNLLLDMQALGHEDAEMRRRGVLSRYSTVLGKPHPMVINAAQDIRLDCDIDPLPL